MVGRPPKPTNLKLVQGTARPCREKDEPKPKLLDVVPKPSRVLNPKLHKVARREWKRVAGQLVKLGLLTDLDLTALECYCLAYERMLAAEEALADGKGLTTSTPNGFVQQRAEVSIAAQARKEVRDFANLFGMSPASRTRISVKKPEGGEISPMERLLRAGR